MSVCDSVLCVAMSLDLADPTRNTHTHTNRTHRETAAPSSTGTIGTLSLSTLFGNHHHIASSSSTSSAPSLPSRSRPASPFVSSRQGSSLASLGFLVTIIEAATVSCLLPSRSDALTASIRLPDLAFQLVRRDSLACRLQVSLPPTWLYTTPSRRAAIQSRSLDTFTLL